MLRLVHGLAHLSTSRRLGLCLALGVLAWWWAPAELDMLTRLVLGWDAYAAVALALIWLAILTVPVREIRRVASCEDLSRSLSMGFVLVAAFASLLAVVALLNTMKELPARALARHVALCVAAVLLGWALLHTVFTLRYAHLYYDLDTDGGEGGILFPGSAFEPDYTDFAYFAFVIGMTAQTADVSISGRRIRRTALLHGVVSYGFNTAIVALSISGLAGVL